HALTRASARTLAQAEPSATFSLKRSYEELVRAGDRLLEGGKGRRAIAAYEEAIKLRPDGAAALTGLGYASMDQGDAERAATLFQRAVWSDGDFAPALFGLGESYRE